MDVNEHKILSNITLDTHLSKGTAVARKYIDVNEHERLSNITGRHTLKLRNSL
jgi:hypothetical protein